MGLKDFKADPASYTGLDVDLRQEMSAIMRVHGHWAILRKRIKDRHCFCWNDQTDEASSDCRFCLGSGWAFVDHLVRLRKQAMFQMSETPDPTGRVNPSLFKFWLQYHVKPDRGDFIAEIALEEESLKRNYQIQPVSPYKIVRMYDIQDVADMREMGGRLEFFTILAEEASFGDPS
jgi:hypothetical protein